jgi:hypothetical protein
MPHDARAQKQKVWWLSQWEGRAVIDAALRAAGIWRDARNLVVTIERAMPDKAPCLKRVLAFVKLSHAKFRLRRFDVAHGRQIFLNIP